MSNVVEQQTNKPVVSLNNEKLSFLTKLSYGFGDFAGSVVWSLASSYLLFFYTDVFGIAGGMAAIILLVARVWDCFVDPILGLIMERTNSKHGRFRPYILYGSLALCALNILTFYTPELSSTGKVIYALITYLLLGTVHSIVTVPYGALATVMTRDTHERTTLNSFRGFFGQIAGIVTGAALMPLIMLLGNGNQQNGFFYASIVLSILSAPLLFMTFKNCKEIITPSKEERPSIKESLMSVVANKPVLLILISLFITVSGIFGRMGTVVYYVIYVLSRPDLVAVIFTILSVFGAIGATLVSYIGRFFEKKTVLIFGSIITGLAWCGLYFTPITDITTIYILTAISGVPLGFSGLMVYSMTADAIDEYQLKTGVRADGAIYSFISLSVKVASALMGALTASILGVIGYVANTKQTPEVVDGINMLVNLAPGILLIVGTIPVFFYQITKARAIENTKKLLERQNQ